MNEIVGNAVDVPGNADRVDQTEDEHHPKRDAWKKAEHAEEVSAMKKSGENRDRVPPRVNKDPGVSRGRSTTTNSPDESGIVVRKLS